MTVQEPAWDMILQDQVYFYIGKPDCVRSKMLPPDYGLGFGCFKKNQAFIISENSVMLCKMAPRSFPSPRPPLPQARGAKTQKLLKSRSHTAVVQPVQLEEVRVAEVHALADDVHEVRDPRYNRGFRPISEGGLAVVHD